MGKKADYNPYDYGNVSLGSGTGASNPDETAVEPEQSPDAMFRTEQPKSNEPVSEASQASEEVQGAGPAKDGSPKPPKLSRRPVAPPGQSREAYVHTPSAKGQTNPGALQLDSRSSRRRRSRAVFVPLFVLVIGGGGAAIFYMDLHNLPLAILSGAIGVVGCALWYLLLQD